VGILRRGVQREGGAPRVLLVDDDPVIVRLLQVNFRLDGFEVDTASSGEKALRRVRECLPDVIVLDVMMPGIDGWGVYAKIKEDPETKGVPVVFLSARAQDEDLRHGYALGVDEYVTKPFDPAHLLEIVRRALARTQRA